jgi:putative membrane protein
MIRFAAYLIANMAAVLAVGTLSERFARYENFESIFVFALILGLINAFIRPVLRLLTLPLTCLTFGLFALVLNVLLFELADRLTDGIEISWWGAAIGSLVASIASGIIFSVLDEQ